MTSNRISAVKPYWVLKNFIYFLILVLFLATAAGNLFAQYLDVGDDPEKIKIVSTQEIIVPSDYEFKGWSPDGEYFAFSRMEWNTNNILKTIIFNKNGQVFKNIEGAIHLWFPDSKNILAVFGEIDFEKLNILTEGKIRLNIYQGSHERAVEDFIYCINVDRGSILYSVDENIYEYEIATGEPGLLHRAENWQITRLCSFKNLLFYTVHCCDAEYKNCKYKNYKFDISNGKLEKIFPIVNDFHCFVPNNNKIVIYFSVMGDRNLYFYDQFSNLLGKIREMGSGLAISLFPFVFISLNGPAYTGIVNLQIIRNLFHCIAMAHI